jgi:hypothetical protein
MCQRRFSRCPRRAGKNSREVTPSHSSCAPSRARQRSVDDGRCRNSFQGVCTQCVPQNLQYIHAMADMHGPNLTTHRAAESIWNRSGWDGTPDQLTATRWLLAVGGGALALQGLRQRSIPGSLLAGVGGSLAWWALKGDGSLADVRCWLNGLADRIGWRAEDRVHDESAESFPASDAPSWTPTVGAGLSDRVRTR